MCGRFEQSARAEYLANLFGVETAGPPPQVTARYNVAPTQTIRLCTVNAEGRRSLELWSWGWHLQGHGPTRERLLVNARAETIHQRPSFRGAFRRRRCLIPADGFYEWKRSGDRRQPFYIHRQDGEVMAFAGIWERRRNPDGSVGPSCLIITTAASPVIAPIHDRMPAIIRPDDFAAWLDPRADTRQLLPLLRPWDGELLEVYPVSSRVNNSASQGEDLIHRID